MPQIFASGLRIRRNHEQARVGALLADAEGC